MGVCVLLLCGRGDFVVLCVVEYYVCVWSCVRVFLCVCFLSLFVCVCPCVCVYVYVGLRPCNHSCVFACVYAFVFVLMFLCVCMYVCTCCHDVCF